MQDKLRIREKQHRNIGNLIRSTYFFWFSILKILISWKSLQILTKNFFSFLSPRRVHHNTEMAFLELYTRDEFFDAIENVSSQSFWGFP